MLNTISFTEVLQIVFLAAFVGFSFGVLLTMYFTDKSK